MEHQDIKAEIEFFDRLAEHADFDTASEAVYSLVLERIEPYLGGRILEAGCGTGAFGLRVRRIKPEAGLVGVDLNAKFIDRAVGGSIYDQAVCADLNRRDLFAEGSFDTIVCPYIIHHFPDITAVLKNMGYWLAPKGHLIIVDPNGSHPVLKLGFAARKFLSWFMDTSSFASKNESHKSLKQFEKNLADFTIKDISTFHHKTKNGNRSALGFTVCLLSYVKDLLIAIHGAVPMGKYKGTDLIIIAEKI